MTQQGTRDVYRHVHFEAPILIVRLPELPFAPYVAKVNRAVTRRRIAPTIPGN